MNRLEKEQRADVLPPPESRPPCLFCSRAPASWFMPPYQSTVGHFLRFTCHGGLKPIPEYNVSCKEYHLHKTTSGWTTGGLLYDTATQTLTQGKNIYLFSITYYKGAVELELQATRVFHT